MLMFFQNSERQTENEEDDKKQPGSLEIYSDPEMERFFTKGIVVVVVVIIAGRTPLRRRTPLERAPDKGSWLSERCEFNTTSSQPRPNGMS